MALWNLFSKPEKKNLWKGMTDVHSHLLPGVDDGFKTKEDSRKMLLFLAEQGVEKMYLTPHIMSDLLLNRTTYLREQFEDFKKYCSDIPVKLHLAAEYMLDECFYERMEEGLLSYDEHHVLVELSCLQPPAGLFDKLYNIQLNGFTPVMAHPERYGYFSLKELMKLKEHGCMFQLNVFSLSGFYGPQAQSNAVALFKDREFDFAGSDIHSLNYQNLYLNYSVKKGLEEPILELIQKNAELVH